MKQGRKPESPEKTPGDELQKMPHTTARRFKPQARLEPAQKHWWQARKVDMLTVTSRVAYKKYRKEAERSAADTIGESKNISGSDVTPLWSEELVLPAPLVSTSFEDSCENTGSNESKLFVIEQTGEKGIYNTKL